uniref:Uncharacterized protein n=1 Tax=Myripristis murdjan TaxID=586833 RepID=A0A668A9P4_9TELE
SGISSGSLEQSFPAAGTKTSKRSLQSLTLRSIFAKPRALDARSLASWKSSLSDRLAVLSSALSQNSLSLFCRPASRKSPVDLSSIPAISLQGAEHCF